MRAKLLQFNVGQGYHDPSQPQVNHTNIIQENICQLSLVNGHLIASHDQNIIPYLSDGKFYYQEVVK